MTTAVYVAGDVHLLEPAGPFLDFLDLLSSKEPARLVILGDLFDYWLETDHNAKQFTAVFERFQTLRKRKWQIDIVLGNREFSAGPRLNAECGARSHWPSLDMRIGQQYIRVVHGDRLCYDPSYHMMAAILRGFWGQGLYHCVPDWVHRPFVNIIRSISKGSSKKPKAVSKLQSIFLDPRRIRAHKRYCQTLIAGHVHQERHQFIDGLEFFIVGDWQGNKGHWIEIDENGKSKQCSKIFTPD